jgi:hypothetical protein
LALGLFAAVDVASGQLLRGRPLLREPEAGAPRRIVVRLTSEAFAPLVDRDVDETRPVQDVILGTRVGGQSRTAGKPGLSLTPDKNAASFVLTLKGTTVSRTVGYNGPAVIRSRSDTNFTATKRVVFQAGQGFVAEPTRVDAQTRITTEGIGSTRPGLRGRIVRRRAAPQVAASRPAAEEIVRQKAMRRVSAAFDRQLEDRLARLNRALDMREVIAFVLRGETEPRYSFCTVDGCVQIVASTGDDDAAEAVQLPRHERQPAPVEVWVHQSLVDEGLAFFLKRFDEARREPGPVLRTLAATAAGFEGDRSSEPPETRVDYATVEDWIVIQFDLGSAPDRQQAAQPAVDKSTPR